jgi:hypothetical protein
MTATLAPAKGLASPLAEQELRRITGTWEHPTGGCSLKGWVIDKYAGSGTAPADLNDCYKLDTYDYWQGSAGYATRYLYLWDDSRKVAFAVEDSIFYGETRQYRECPAHDCLWADARMWAETAVYVRECIRVAVEFRRYCQAYEDSLKPRVGLEVVVVSGRKVAKGTVATIERLFDGNYGPSVLLNGVWTALSNVRPTAPAPSDEALMGIYERRFNPFYN